MDTRRKFLKVACLSAASMSSACSFGGSSADPWSAGEIAAMETALARHGPQGWAMWQGGRQVARWRPEERGPSLSITKSLAALAASRAAAEGWLAPDERVSTTLTEWRGDPMKSRITVLMLLQQVSGLEPGVIPLYRNHPKDKGSACLGLRSVDTPGTVFRYGPSHWETLAELMKRKLSARGETPAAFMQRAVMRPIGLNAGNWLSDKQGVPYFSTGTELTVAELGRLGATLCRLLQGHDADGIQAAHFAAMTRASAVNPTFGGGLWKNTHATRPSAAPIEVERHIDGPLPSSFWGRACLSTRQPADLVALIGSGGRRVYIWPARERRIARLGSSAGWSDVAFLSRAPA